MIAPVAGGGASSSLLESLEDSTALPPGAGQYADFHTIDWLREVARDRMRHRNILRRRGTGVFARLKDAHDAWSGWICVLLVGCIAGRCFKGLTLIVLKN